MLRSGISNEAYHADPALGRSVAYSMRTSCPMKVKHMMEKPTPSTPALVNGSMIHSGALEPQKLDEEFKCKPTEIDGNSPRTNAYKEAFAVMEADNPCVTYVPHSDYENNLEVIASVSEHPLLKELLYHEDSKIEHTGFFDFEGVSCKVRPDLYNTSNGVIMDLKTTQDASVRGFTKSVRQFGYVFQAAWYMTALRQMGEKPKKFIFLVVEKTEPYITACYTLDNNDIEREVPNVIDAIKEYGECLKSDVWPGYTDDITTLNLGTPFTENRLSITKASEKFGVSRSYIYKLIKKHGLETLKVRNRQTISMYEFSNALRWEHGKAA